jgi:hypothetical protein
MVDRPDKAGGRYLRRWYVAGDLKADREVMVPASRGVRFVLGWKDRWW